MNLANKYRPSTFEDVVGQDVTITILKNLINKKCLQHSMLFIGPAGSGKTTCARIVANMIDGEIFEIDSASNNGVSDIKDIINQSKLYSLTHKYKVFILDEAHTITSAAWSALLITLEEQSKNSFFIFCTTEDRKIPDTILSRIQRFNFVAIDEGIIFDRINKISKLENINTDENALRFIAHKSNGNLRTALSYIDKCILYSNDIDLEKVLKVLNILDKEIIDDLFYKINHNKISACQMIKDIQNNGYNLYTMLETALDYFIQDSVKNNQNKLDEIEFILDIMQDLKYMIANPGNVCNFICAKIMVKT
jgi:DNA polymerase-3 subunit gamma/tau